MWWDDREPKLSISFVKNLVLRGQMPPIPQNTLKRLHLYNAISIQCIRLQGVAFHRIDLGVWFNPLNPGHFYEFRKFIKNFPSGYHKVKPFYSGRIASKLMAKHTSLLTKNTAFVHKFHVDMRKWQPNTMLRNWI
jgi:hypothetical protein